MVEKELKNVKCEKCGQYKDYDSTDGVVYPSYCHVCKQITNSVLSRGRRIKFMYDRSGNRLDED